MNLFTTRETAVILGYSENSIRAMIFRGKIRAQKMGHVWTITSREIKRLQAKKEERDQKSI